MARRGPDGKFMSAQEALEYDRALAESQQQEEQKEGPGTNMPQHDGQPGGEATPNSPNTHPSSSRLSSSPSPSSSGSLSSHMSGETVRPVVRKPDPDPEPLPASGDAVLDYIMSTPAGRRRDLALINYARQKIRDPASAGSDSAPTYVDRPFSSARAVADWKKSSDEPLPSFGGGRDIEVFLTRFAREADRQDIKRQHWPSVVGHLLKGAARTWWDTEKATDRLEDDWDGVVRQLRQRWVARFASVEAFVDLSNLRRKSRESIEDFFSRFQTVLVRLSSYDPTRPSALWLDAFLAALPSPLRTRIEDQFVMHRRALASSSLDELLQIARDIDRAHPSPSSSSLNHLSSSPSHADDLHDLFDGLEFQVAELCAMQGGREPGREMECWNCGESGHRAMRCPQPRTEALDRQVAAYRKARAGREELEKRGSQLAALEGEVRRLEKALAVAQAGSGKGQGDRE